MGKVGDGTDRCFRADYQTRSLGFCNVNREM